jgi:hypothetical protein
VAPTEAAGAPAPDASDAVEEELMWLGDEFRPSSTAWQGLGEAAAASPPSPAPRVDETKVEDEELDRLARLRGWDEAELSAIRSLLGDRPEAEAEAAAGAEATAEPQAPLAAPPPGEIRLPGGEELDGAFAAFRGASDTDPVFAEESTATPAPAEDTASMPAEAGAASRVEETAGEAPEPGNVPPATLPVRPPSTTSVSAPRLPSRPARMTDEDWLRGRRGPAANAYRRLRRLFPG